MKILPRPQKRKRPVRFSPLAMRSPLSVALSMPPTARFSCSPPALRAWCRTCATMRSAASSLATMPRSPRAALCAEAARPPVSRSATASSAVLSMHSARRSTARVTSAPRATAPSSAPHRASSTASRSTRLWKPAFSPSIPCSRLAAASVSLSSATARPVKPPSRSIPF